MRMTIGLAIACCLLGAAGYGGQREESLPRVDKARFLSLERTIEAMRAAEAKGDKAKYASHVADALHWETPDGRVLTKTEHLDHFTGGPRLARYSPSGTSISGETATVYEVAEFMNGRVERRTQTFVEQVQRWLLTQHTSEVIK